MDLEGDPLIQIGVAGALSREMQQDHEQLIQFLAHALQSAFPNEVELKTEGGFLSKKKLVGFSIRLGDDVFTLLKPSRGPLEGTKTHVVRGIALKTEPLRIDEWLKTVSAEIESRATQDSAIRSALASTLGLG